LVYVPEIFCVVRCISSRICPSYFSRDSGNTAMQYVESGGACSDRRASGIGLLSFLMYFIMDLLVFIEGNLGSRLKLVV
jgi:hypothetical protein